MGGRPFGAREHLLTVCPADGDKALMSTAVRRSRLWWRTS